MENPENIQEPERSVSRRVLDKFIAALAEEPELKDVSDRLARALGQAKLNEATLRAVLFGDAAL